VQPRDHPEVTAVLDALTAAALTSGAHRADLDRLAAGGGVDSVRAGVFPTTSDDLVALTDGIVTDFGAAA
jgi:hypothetical protein